MSLIFGSRWVWLTLASTIDLWLVIAMLCCHIVAACLFISFLAVWPGLCLAAQFPVLADHLRWLFNADNKPRWREEGGEGEGREQETTITHFLHNTYNAFKHISLCNALYGETVIFFSTQEWLNKTRNMRQTALDLNVIHSTFL